MFVTIMAATVVVAAGDLPPLPRNTLWPHSAHELGMSIQIPQGLSVRNGGDIDGDGSEEILVTTGHPDAPFAILFGSPFSPGLTNWDDPAYRATTFTFRAPPDSDLVYWPVMAGPAGDVNSDGFVDFLLGTFAEIEPLSGDVLHSWFFLVFGDPGLPGKTYALSDRLPEGLRGTKLLGPGDRPDLFADSTASGKDCTCTIDGGGDLNADGRQDVVLGVHRFYRASRTRHGMVIVLFGRETWPLEASVNEYIADDAGSVIEKPTVWTELFRYFPLTAFHAGDIDGDGRGELAMSGADYPALDTSGGNHFSRSWIVFGSDLQPGDRVSLDEIDRTQWAAESVIVTDGAGDMDRDGLADILFFTLPLSGVALGDPSRGGILYGQTRPALATVQSPTDLHAGNATFIENRAFTCDMFMTESGVRRLVGGRDVSGDGIPDIMAGYPGRHVCRGLGTPAYPVYRDAGEAAIVIGVDDRSPAIAPETPTLEGCFHEEALGHYSFFATLAGTIYVGLGSTVSFDGDDASRLLLTFLPVWLTPPIALSVDYVQKNSSTEIELIGAGFTEELRVFFGERESPEITLVNHSVAAIQVPEAPPGEEVTIEVRRGDERVLAPATFLYPTEGPTQTVDLSLMIGTGVSRIYSSTADLYVYPGILAGDLDGDTQNEIVVPVKERSSGHRCFYIISHELADVEGLDLAGDSPLVESRVLLSAGDDWNRVIDAGDLDGDGINDLALADNDERNRFAILFGGAHLSGEVTVEQGENLLIIYNRPSDMACEPCFPGDLDGDGVDDLYCGYWHEPGEFASIILKGRSSWRDRGEVRAEVLLEDGEALYIDGCLGIVPGGDLDGVWPPDIVLHGQKDGRPGGGSGWVVVLIPGGLPPDLAGYMTLSQLVEQTQASVKWPGNIRFSLMPRGSFTIDRFGTEGILMLEESSPFPTPLGPGRLITLAGDAWDELPEQFYLGFEEPAGRMSFIMEDGLDVLLGGGNDSEEINLVGDFNGDGADDALLPVMDATRENYQRVYLLYGGAEFISGASRPVTALGSIGVDLGAAGREMNHTWGPACDLNADGFSDLLLGFRGDVSPSPELFLVLGRREPLSLRDADPFRRGDANADGGMNVADAVFILQNLFANGPAILCPDAADTNDDEEVNIADPVYILQFLFVDGPAIPAPYPDCANDVTPDPQGGPDLPACSYCPEACQDPPVPCPAPR